MKYYFISGETSGDNHASRVMLELKKLDKQAFFRGMGGDMSREAGQELVIHQKEMAIMGFAEVLGSIFKILKNIRSIKKDIITWKPDVVILVDYPGFNFKIARYAFKNKIPVHYYISPKVWAWKEGRVELIRKYVSELYCILPFEKDYFAKKGIKATYVGNPSKETVDAFLATNILPASTNKIALLPGSRKQEISTSLPIMLEAIKQFPKYEAIVAQAPGFEEAYYHAFDPSIKLIPDNMYQLLAQCDAAIVTSGTATLETALMNVPQVVCYKTTKVSYTIAKAVVKLKYISLVNLILDAPCVKELIQDDFEAEKLGYELHLVLKSKDKIAQIALYYKELHALIGESHPSVNVANNIWRSIAK
jgi:lipid-A-disaccharide synthase